MKRLEELRRKQGSDIDALKSEFELDFHLDEKRAMELNGKIDKKIYNVWTNLLQKPCLLMADI